MIRDKILLLGSKFFPLRVDPTGKGAKMKMKVDSPESVPITPKQKFMNKINYKHVL